MANKPENMQNIIGHQGNGKKLNFNLNSIPMTAKGLVANKYWRDCGKTGSYRQQCWQCKMAQLGEKGTAVFHWFVQFLT